MTPGRFRLLVGAATAAHLWWLSLATAPAGYAQPFYYALLIAAAAGLLLLQWWSRAALLVALAVGSFAAPPADRVIGPVALLLGGIVLGISFCPPMAGRFARREWQPLGENEVPDKSETLFVPIVQGDQELIDVTASWLEASRIEFVVEEGRLLVRAEDADTARSILAEAAGEMRPN